MGRYVDLSEKVTATFYSDEYEEWTQQTVTIADVLDSVCDDYTVLPTAQPEIIRCEDCKYQSKGQNECETWNLCGYRPWQYTPTTDEHFCSYAERRTE